MHNLDNRTVLLIIGTIASRIMSCCDHRIIVTAIIRPSLAYMFPPGAKTRSSALLEPTQIAGNHVPPEQSVSVVDCSSF